MTTEQRALRNRLRAHGRQLGDTRDAKRGTQTIDRLVHECAYEHWHRMLFARFLAENHLLIEPNSGVAITMAECEELARDAGEDPWALASRFAQRMLPQIFRPDDPVLAVGLPPETRQALEQRQADLPAAVFIADDALGWTYQFWQSAEKDRVNASGEKITGATLPAVTQLFTEHYMVLFLLHNTIGAWHAGKVLAQRPELADSAAGEQELRDAVALSDYQFEYLRFVREPGEGDEEGNPTGPWRPAAGTFEGWPKHAAELTVLDPSCGSGHFLVEVFLLLARLRMADEDLSLEDAIRQVLKDNVFGLELDARCTQIAAFNLALAAWRMISRVIDLQGLNIACSGLGPQSSEEQWLKLAEQAPEAWKRIPAHAREPVRNGLGNLHRLFSQAPELGSLIDPEELPADLITADYETLRPFLQEALKAESGDEEARERAFAASGMAKAAEILVGPADAYTLIITNVPYLGRSTQGEILKSFADMHYKSARQDLATIMIDRSRKWIGRTGSIAVVTRQNALFQTRYRKLRETFLRHNHWKVVCPLGPAAFETISGEVVNAALLILGGEKPGESACIAGVDAQAARNPREKAALLRGEGIVVGRSSDTTGSIHVVLQRNQLHNPEARVILTEARRQHLLSEHTNSWQGIKTSDDPRFTQRLWEQATIGNGWVRYQRTPERTADYVGRSEILFWEDGEGQLTEVCQDGAPFRGQGAWGRTGVAVHTMGDLPVTLYTGEKFSADVSILDPTDQRHVVAIWTYACTGEYRREVRRIDRALRVTNKALKSVPFDFEKWSQAADQQFPSGLPKPCSDDPRQWPFHGHPAHCILPACLQVSVARLLGYNWPAELDDQMCLSETARQLVAQCDELGEFGDEDGIVCLWPVRGEAPAADRVRALLAKAFGDAWSASKERELLQAAANEFNKGKAARSLEDWLVDRFLEEHCKLFHQRPFVWHIWDGRADGFNALVNYHKLAGPDGEGRRTLESLTFSYLGDWIERQRADQAEGKEGADARLAAALDLQEQLKKILAGEPPYDIFVRWKPLHEQPIGWEPDINDGVRLNIRPFLSAALRKGGKKGAGILRAKPNIKWTKDRGKEPESLRPKTDFPWFWSCDPEKKPEHRQNFMGGAKFDGNRWNDLHYSNEVKRAARER